MCKICSVGICNVSFVMWEYGECKICSVGICNVSFVMWECAVCVRGDKGCFMDNSDLHCGNVQCVLEEIRVRIIQICTVGMCSVC